MPLVVIQKLVLKYSLGKRSSLFMPSDASPGKTLLPQGAPVERPFAANPVRAVAAQRQQARDRRSTPRRRVQPHSPDNDVPGRPNE
jgi:hypothetical protein